jgi:peptidyl-prolyl cis-trans isomerase B (cyclophilin B)
VKYLGVLLLLLLVAGCGGGDGGGSAGGGGNSSSSECEVTPDVNENPPDITPLEEGKAYQLVVKTNKGAFTVALDTKTSPCTTASIVQLANRGFFNGTIFHRIVPGFVIQGGDPTGTGSGGPGYKTIDTPPETARYTKGVVAMAKTMDEAPGTSGSQFFVVTGGDVGLPPEYAILGKVVDGLDVVERIGKLGDASEQPTQRVVIETATVQ